ncbi:hypothetical protein PLICRDRAFT_172882 [Plicaturopsis crispa FD-325 SS-3]|nr:hypothetical protein PLICRDRAFT_172882 [Plicaturopsis crispa FD-325 SS-3]
MSAAPVENPIILNLSSIYGPVLAGNLLASALWGISFFYFFSAGTKDPKVLQFLVAFLWVTDTVVHIISMKSMWPVLIIQWGRVEGLLKSQREQLHRMWISSIVTLGVQFFFLLRIYRLGGKRWLIPCLMIVPMALWQMFGTIPYLVPAFRDMAFTNLTSPREVHIALSLRVVGAAVDILIAAAMTYLLQASGQTQFKSSKRLIYRLVMVSINSGFWTALVSCIDLVLILTMDHSFAFTIVEYPLSALYLNTLLANLNIRSYLKKLGPNDWNSVTESIVLSSTHGTYGSRGRNASHPSAQQDRVALELAVRIDTSTAVKGDGDLDSRYSPQKESSDKLPHEGV